MIKLLIADDHTIVCEGLKQLFAMTQDIKEASAQAWRRRLPNQGQRTH
jgi:YesN/AraC family two-component response regulator